MKMINKIFMTISFLILMYPIFSQKMSPDTSGDKVEYSRMSVSKQATKDSFFLTGGHRWGIHLVSNILWLESGIQYFLRKNLSAELGYSPLLISSFSFDGLSLGINYYPVREKTVITPFFNSFFPFTNPYEGINPILDKGTILGFRVGIFVSPNKMKLYLLSRIGFIIGFTKESKIWKHAYAPSFQFGIGLII